MSYTIEVPGDLASRLSAAGIPAEEASRFAVAALRRVADQAEAAGARDSADRAPADVAEAVAALVVAVQDMADGDEGISLEEYTAGTSARDQKRDAAERRQTPQ